VHFDKFKAFLPTNALCIKTQNATACQSHAAQHPVHTLQPEAHIATAQKNFNDEFLLIISTKTVTLVRFRRMLPVDGPNGPKHVGTI
jgi:hypothetical protein